MVSQVICDERTVVIRDGHQQLLGMPVILTHHTYTKRPQSEGLSLVTYNISILITSGALTVQLFMLKTPLHCSSILQCTAWSAVHFLALSVVSRA